MTICLEPCQNSCQKCQTLKDTYAEEDPQESYICPDCDHVIWKHDPEWDPIDVRITLQTVFRLPRTEVESRKGATAWEDWLHHGMLEDGMNFLDTRFTSTKVEIKDWRDINE